MTNKKQADIRIFYKREQPVLSSIINFVLTEEMPKKIFYYIWWISIKSPVLSGFWKLFLSFFYQFSCFSKIKGSMILTQKLFLARRNVWLIKSNNIFLLVIILSNAIKKKFKIRRNSILGDLKKRCLKIMLSSFWKSSSSDFWYIHF